jgi:carbon storage regulator CsrA
MGRLALTRKANESSRIGKDITIKVVSTGRRMTRLLIEAPDNVSIVRTELEKREDAKVETKVSPQVDGQGNDRPGSKDGPG